jgi:glycosyltransferase involved in cell wall biosynthesis
MEKKKKILMIYTNYSSFVRNDYEILCSEFEVARYQVALTKGIFNLAFCLIKEFIYLILNIWRFNVIFIWFADYHSLLPVLFAKLSWKKSFIVNGGYDVARIPDLNYGVFCSKLRGFFSSYSMRNCTLNLPVSNFVARKVKAITHNDNYRVVYNCVNIPEGLPVPSSEREIILTVGLIDSERTFYIKGIDTFTEVAGLLPQFKFVIVGININKLKWLIEKFPANVKCIEAVDHKELINFYLKAKIYCQFSRIESFGVALAEAIQSGCIPLVTNEGALPEIVGNKGFIVSGNLHQTAKTVEYFYLIGTLNGKLFDTNTIKNSFSLNRRRESLIKYVSGY